MGGGDKQAQGALMKRGWTDHDASLQVKCEDEGIDYERLNVMMTLGMQAEMDFKNRVESFKSVAMSEPFDPNIKDSITVVK